ncbi:TPA: hypothetical protein QB349_001736 [Pasteurella multocida]|nr:hypothetical protein [Pasteurella multocida]
MKKLILLLPALFLVGCVAQKNVESAQMDLKTLEEYNQRVKSGNTVDPSQKQAYPKEVEHQANLSDTQPKVVERRSRLHPVPLLFLPTVSYQYSRHYIKTN